MSVDRKVPEIRFKGYSGKWVDVTLSNIVDVRSGKDYKHLGNGNIPVYGTGGYMLSVDGALSNNEDAIGIGRKGTIDKPYILRAPFWTVDTLFYAVPFSNFNIDFLFCFFQKIDWKKYDESTGVPSLSKVAINSVLIHTTNKLEQTTIGNYFQKLDTLINQHQKKHDKLCNIKKAMLEKMFPKQGKTIPEIRFKDFSGQWEEKAIYELFTITRGNVLSANKTSPIPTTSMCYPVYSSQTKNNGLMGFYDKYLFETAITWTTDGANAGTVNFRDSKFYSTNVNGVLLSNKGYANKAIAEILNKEAWRHVSHVGNPKLMNNVMSTIKITIPNSIAEQNAISNYFQKLDNLINQHQQQITKLNNIKQACLSKMFV